MILLDILDFLGQLFEIPWIYRGWVYVFSKSYREERRRIWRNKGPVYRYIDIVLTILVTLVEIGIVGLAIAYIAFHGNLR